MLLDTFLKSKHNLKCIITVDVIIWEAYMYEVLVLTETE